MEKRTCLLFILLLFFLPGLIAQNLQEATNVEVSKLSDQQIQLIINEVNARGLTIEQAAQMAQLQGASAIQVEELKKRISEMQQQNSQTEKTDIQPLLEKTKSSAKDKLSVKKSKEPTPIEQLIYGFQFFNTETISFEPPVNIPTPSTYAVGIGDELTITVWGASQKTYKLKVETSGAITIPDVGTVTVSGLEFNKVRELIRKRLITIYQGMTGNDPNTFCEVTLSNMRSIVVTVIGEANFPGSYTLPATASAFNALYLAGGPNANGSFRSIKVIRDNKTISTIDVYDFLINGHTTANIQLRDQDVLYIPVYEKRITTSGAFKRTGFFELIGHETLADLVRFTGGFGEKALNSQVSVTRITGREKKLLDINHSIFDSFILQNGDSVYSAKVINRFENRVSISGAVYLPGQYELSEGLTLSGLIDKAQGLKESYYSRGMIIRLQSDLSPIIVPFDLDDMKNGGNNPNLQREDRIVINDRFKMQQKQTLQIFGEVQRPGEYEYAGQMTLKDLIIKAGGFNEAASESFIELARRHTYSESEQILDEMVKLYQFDINRNLGLDQTADTFYLKPFDYVYVRRAPSYQEQRTVYITGEVRYPGAYSIGSKSERVSDLIKRAGGLMPTAYIKGANMKRVNQQAEQNIDILEKTIEDTLLAKVENQITDGQLELRLERILKEPGTEFDYLLKDGDQINIPEFSQEVRISGEIRNPIGLAFENGKSLKYYVDRNGGFGEKASKRKVFVIYSDGTTQVTRNLIWPIYPVIEPGCQIIIPPKVEKIRIDNTGKWLSVASTMASILLVISNLTK